MCGIEKNNPQQLSAPTTPSTTQQHSIRKTWTLFSDHTVSLSFLRWCWISWCWIERTTPSNYLHQQRAAPPDNIQCEQTQTIFVDHMVATFNKQNLFNTCGSSYWLCIISTARQYSIRKTLFILADLTILLNVTVSLPSFGGVEYSWLICVDEWKGFISTAQHHSIRKTRTIFVDLTILSNVTVVLLP